MSSDRVYSSLRHWNKNKTCQNNVRGRIRDYFGNHLCDIVTDCPRTLHVYINCFANSAIKARFKCDADIALDNRISCMDSNVDEWRCPFPHIFQGVDLQSLPQCGHHRLSELPNEPRYLYDRGIRALQVIEGCRPEAWPRPQVRRQPFGIHEESARNALERARPRLPQIEHNRRK